MTPSTPLLAQVRLRQTREEFRILLLIDETSQNNHFPRSATIKWLLSGAGQQLIGGAAGTLAVKLVPVVSELLRSIPVMKLIRNLFARR